MMPQQAYQEQQSSPAAQPKRFDIFFHFIKTFRLLGALLKDRRIPVIRKFFFLGAIALLLVLLFFPDFISEVGLSAILPFIGTLLGIPLDAGVDWIAFALILVSLLRIFPAAIVSEHYQQIFG